MYIRTVELVLQSPISAQRESAKTILGLVLAAKRTLKWHEIQGAISIDPENCVVDFRSRRLRMNAKDLCGSLVQIRTNGSVELVHMTARQ